MVSPTLIGWVALVVAASPVLDLDSVLARSRPSPERLAVEAELAAAARELASTRGGRFEVPVLTLEAGPRRTPEDDDFDLALGVDVPVATDQAARRTALEAHERARLELPAAADVAARLEVELAYVNAWEAGEALALAERSATAAESWLASVRSRVAAGAEAPYEASLVAAEAQAARVELAAAREAYRLAWAELAARTEVGEEAVSLSTPAEPAPLRAEHGAGHGVENGLLARAIQARLAWSRSLAELEAARAGSRWSVAASLGREGDEDVARVGVGWRLTPPEQATTRAAALAAANVAATREADLALARLRARLAGARERQAALGSADVLSDEEIATALAALEAREAAGKDRPSQVLPLRRQLVAALAAANATRAARLRAAFEIRALTLETTP